MRLHLLATLLFFSFSLSAQQWSRVKILLDEAHTIENLAQMGLDVDHGKHQPFKYFTGEFADYEIAKMQAAGFKTETLVADLQAHLSEMDLTGENDLRSLPPCAADEVKVYETPANYTYGTMAGYVTYQQLLDVLDSMAAKYPNLFKARQPVSSVQTTHEGRPIFWVKISDNPNSDEMGEPELMYTALHHAREPNSLSQMIFYMWWLLENYGTNNEVKYLVDNTEMYFIPCINVDGYIYNETTNPAGGGFWRKNRRDNLDGTFGVDLNRNYGYEWGYDDNGSSPVTDAQTYRGPGPSSEPETQMVQDFCLAHQFGIVLNYHTHGDLLIYPWGFANALTQDHPTFGLFGGLLSRENNFKTGLATQTVGYNVNGTSDDWMYAPTPSKPKIFAYTPEVGPSFWPGQTAIDALNKSCMTMNLTAAHLVLNYGEATPAGDRYLADLQGDVNFSLKKIGLASGALSVSLEPVSDNIQSVGNPAVFGLFHLEEVGGNLQFVLKNSIQKGDTILFNLVVDNGLYQWKQPIVRIYTDLAHTPFFEPGNDLSQWDNLGDWATTAEHFVSAPTSLTDSPNNDYQPNNINEITLDNPVTVENADAVYLSFWTKWDIEEDEDYAQVLVSLDGSPYIPLCGKYTEEGTPEQDSGEPLYDGTQNNWVLEEIDLSEYLALGDVVDFKIAIRMVSDNFIEADGFYVDDFTFTVLSNSSVSTHHLTASDFSLSSRPNPAGDFVVIDIQGEMAPSANAKLHIFNTLGQEIHSENVQGNLVRLDTKGWQSGVYYYRLSVDGQFGPAGKVVIGRI